MSRFAIKLQCPNPECLYAENQPGQPICDRCQNPLTHRYLWAVGRGAAQISTGTLVDCRYMVVSPQIWLDTQPGLPPKEPFQAIAALLPYLHLYPHRLHLPDLFAIYESDEMQSPILLLNNAPIDQPGQLQPLLEVAWANASAVRQLNWLWQMLQLWQPLKEQGVVSSLLNADNLHVEGWRLRLRELIVDRPAAEPSEAAELAEIRPLVTLTVGATVDSPRSTGASRPLTSPYFDETAPFANVPTTPGLQDLAEIWQSWIEDAQPEIREALGQLCQDMRSTPDTETGRKSIVDRLNQLLLSQAATLPLHLEVAGDSTTGTQRSHNEDACFPNRVERPMEGLLPYVGIVCDGIGGHEGGEVASQMAVRSLQLQLRTWLTEVMAQSEPLPPQVIEQQLVEVVRVVNNLIAAQNDMQGREQRQRMATTLVMAVQAPQKIVMAEGSGNSHELYLVHVGDSRAYWLTPHACQCLTVDDDVTTREVRAGRSLYTQAGQRTDALALTQALGTREGSQLKITVQRFVLDEDGLLLLCSDGLSDNGLVEHLWDSVTQAVLDHQITLKNAVENWLQLANRHNGHDNASIVLMHCQVRDQLQLMELTPAANRQTRIQTQDSELTESAKALLYDEEGDTQPRKEAVLPKQTEQPAGRSFDRWMVAMGAATLMFILGALSIAIWRQLAPTGFAPDRSAPVESVPESLPDPAPSPAPSTENNSPDSAPIDAAPASPSPIESPVTDSAPANAAPVEFSQDTPAMDVAPTESTLEPAPTDSADLAPTEPAVEAPLTDATSESSAAPINPD